MLCEIYSCSTVSGPIAPVIPLCNVEVELEIVNNCIVSSVTAHKVEVLTGNAVSSIQSYGALIQNGTAQPEARVNSNNLGLWNV